MYDVIVVGAGVVGCSTARELSRYKLDVLVLEKGHDICAGASKANSGMIHAGYDPIPGTNEAKFNAPGSKMMYEICDELDVPYEKSGTTVFATDESGMKELQKLEEDRRLGKAAGPVRKRGVASNEMCTFLIVNISSLQLIPVSVIAYRSQYGSVNPTAVVGPGIVATAVSTGAAILFCRIMDRKS